jgi:hypothetical protein
MFLALAVHPRVRICAARILIRLSHAVADLAQALLG